MLIFFHANVHRSIAVARAEDKIRAGTLAQGSVVVGPSRKGRFLRHATRATTAGQRARIMPVRLAGAGSFVWNPARGQALLLCLTVITTLPRACLSSKYRNASATSVNW